MTDKEAKYLCSSLGLRLTKYDGEYRVAFMGLPRGEAEASAYYTTDLADAVVTALRMSKDRRKPKR